MRVPFLRLAIVGLMILLPSPARADFVSGSTGADGAFSPIINTTVDLSQAGTGAGTGVYDAAHWAIVFNYTGVTVPSGVTVTFKNHPSGAPVVWLVAGSAKVSGIINLSGANGLSASVAPSYAEPGPGGFQGGRRTIETGVTPGTAGLGPGGAQWTGSAGTGANGGYGTLGSNDFVTASGGGATYGNEAILPLIGGSGGSAGDAPFSSFGGGGAGGGAILVAASDSIVISTPGAILARGGNGSNSARGGGGSGGAIRLIADAVGGDGILRANGGAWNNNGAVTGGKGRIRVESPVAYLTDVGDPAYAATSVPGPIFPDASAPTLAVTSVSTAQGTVPAPADPLAGILTTDVLVPDSLVVPVTLHIVATNVPTGTTVDVLVIRDAGPRETFTSTPLSGSLVSSTATCVISLARGRKTEVLLRVNFTPAGPVTSPPTSVRP